MSSSALVNARDVTERVLAERSLRDSEERYRTLTEASPDMIYLVGADCRVQYVNGQAAQRFGVSAERLIGRPIAEMFEGVTGARIVAAVEQVLASGEPYEADSMIAYPDGDRWVCTRLVALKEDGRVSGVLGVSQDVTDRRLAQDALAESERRYRSLFEDSRLPCGRRTTRRSKRTSRHWSHRESTTWRATCVSTRPSTSAAWGWLARST